MEDWPNAKRAKTEHPSATMGNLEEIRALLQGADSPEKEPQMPECVQIRANQVLNASLRKSIVDVIKGAIKR